MNPQFEKHVRQVDHLLQIKQDRKLTSYLVRLEPHVIADILEQLELGEIKTFGLLPPEIQAEVAILLSEHARELIIPHLSVYSIARFLHFNDEDDAVDILQVLSPKKQNLILEKIKQDKRKKIQKLLKFHPETAGGLMDLNFLIVPVDMPLPDIAREVKEYIKRENQSPIVIAEDSTHKIRGYIPYQHLLIRTANDTVRKMLAELPLISSTADQEHVIEFAFGKRADVIGVIDPQQQIAGIIRTQDLIRVVEEEATEDIFRFAGVSAEEDIFDGPMSSVRRRYRWLLLNVATASVGSMVVAHFQGTIEHMAILAAFMPMVAGLGGNAGTQALAITVRGLSKQPIGSQDVGYIVKKELLAGIVNGSVVGLVAGILGFIITRNSGLGSVLFLSLLIIVVLSSTIGSLIPLVLKKLKIDPAVASSVFVTATIDVFGFLIFLGLATLILL